MEMNTGIVHLLINKIYEENLPIGCLLGKKHCIDQSIAGFENKQYMQEVTLYYDDESVDVANELINQCVCEYSQM